MEDCISYNKKQVPLIKVVKAAIIDVYGNISALQQLYSHWAARGLNKLQRESLKVGITKVIISVNKNGKYGTLPPDFDTETFVGFINDKGQKVPLKLNVNLADSCHVDEIGFEDKCTSCGQDKSICEDLAITEDRVLVVINSSTYENVTVKKMYPNGDYYLEKNEWVLNVSNNTVDPKVTKEFITNFDLKPCGCIETTINNIEKLKTHSLSTYCSGYAECSCETSEYGYKIFPDTGVIQFDFNFPYDKIYMEYLGFMAKKNGQYQVPEVAFETLVEWIKWKSIKDKKGVEKWRIDSVFDDYTRERKSMMKVLTRVSLATIVSIIRKTPKFNLDYNDSWYSCFSVSNFSNTTALISGQSGGSASSSGGGGTTIINNPTTVINNASYQLSVVTGQGVGHPADGESTYQNNVLKGATDLNFIILAKQILVKDAGDFTFDSNSGTISIYPNKFFIPDTLVIPYNKTT